MNHKWVVATLGDICEKPQYGFTASAENAACGPRFLRITDLKNGNLNWDNVPYCRGDEKQLSRYLLKNGDLVVARIGATTGKTSLITNVPSAVFASYLIRLRPKPKVNPYFLYFLTQSVQYWSWINGNKDNNLKGGVNAGVLTQIECKIPPLYEQQKIAAILWKVQQAIELQEKLIATTKELKQAAMQQLFTKGLCGEKQKETAVSALPKGWNLRRLDDCCAVASSSLSYTDFEQMDEATNGNAVHAMGIKVSDMNLPGNESYIVRANLQKRIESSFAEKKLVPADTVVFPKRGAAIATNKKRLTTAWTVLDPNLIGVRAGNEVDVHFLFYWFQNFDLRSITEPGPTPQLNKKNLTPLLLPISDLDEQKEISAILQKIDKKIFVHESKRNTLQEFFQSLLNQLMTGQIRVADLKINVSDVI